MEGHTTDKLVLKSIYQLFKYKFYIPSYQRGYRWTKLQVEQLLNDIWHFSKRDDKTKGEFYCLQPIVVRHLEDKYEVIDGQQRLTTIYLIIKYLEDLTRIAFHNLHFTPPTYETRTDSRVFLETIKQKTETDAHQNIDFYHIWKAYGTIKCWFENEENNINPIDFVNTLLKVQNEEQNGETTDVANNVRVIWYEVNVAESSDSIDIFTRLNIGKIPLTNSELIKALLLQKSNFLDAQATIKQLQIATEWDIIEKTLQDDAFWFFIYNPDNPIKYDNRIEYIFDLMKGRTKDSEYYHTFNEFNKDFTVNKKGSPPDIDNIWLEIKKYFLTFDEWYKDYELFHYVGFLIDSGISIKTIKDESSGRAKDDFKNNYLKKGIQKQVNCNIDEIEYPDKKIKKILLLFNILTVLETQKSDMRFPFHKYKSEDWDIEHIRSQANKTITSNKRVEWTNDILEYFTGSDDIQKAEEFKCNLQDDNVELKNILSLLITCKNAEKIEERDFDDIFQQVQKYFKEDNQTEDKNDISNLALLDSTTNRSYGNSFSPIKRKRIIENDSKGIFVPIATKNLFLKYYSKKLGDVMYWNNDDAKDYLDAIKITLKDYLTVGGQLNE
jgi:uncharacterized protein with ParB-like and HNH nuclease domain